MDYDPEIKAEIHKRFSVWISKNYLQVAQAEGIRELECPASMSGGKFRDYYESYL